MAHPNKQHAHSHPRKTKRPPRPSASYGFQRKGIYKPITEREKRQVAKAGERVFREYGDVIRRLGEE